jgi:DNA polymerase-3 subunit epsilon
MTKIPKTIVAVDVETTGLHSSDRIITFGGLRLNLTDLSNDNFQLDWLYFIADPGKKSHPKAEEVHGYSDWFLRHQEPFSENANVASDFISSGDIVIAHNASFDCEFIDREYRLLGRPAPQYKSYCTMNRYRQSGLPGRASLGAICEQIGLARIDQKHGALEDAWLALMVYFRLNGLSKYIRSYEYISQQGLPSLPTNLAKAPTMPSGPLPRRKKKQKEISIGMEMLPGSNSEHRKALMAAVQPTAVLLLEIARSDKSLKREEIDILVSLVRETRDRLRIGSDDRVEIDVVADLFDIEISQTLLNGSAEAVYSDSYAREAFPKWFASMAAADGEISNLEQYGIERVKAAIAKAANG